jgi:hypothetical protein
MKLRKRYEDKKKIYSLHEPDVYVIAKGKDHKQYEYGNKVSIVSTKDNNIIVGVVSHDKNIHDSKTLDAPTFCQNKKIVVAISHFLKFQAQAAIKTLISSPTCPLSRFLESLNSDFKCPIIGSMAARLLYSLRFLSRVVSHDKNIHDSKTLDAAITHANSNRTKPIQQAVCDRGYVGVKEVLAQVAINTLISSPTCPLSRFLDNLKSDFKCPIIGSMAARLLGCSI